MKILVMRQPIEGVSREEMLRHAPAEIQAVWELYKQGVVREFYTRAIALDRLRRDPTGPLFRPGAVVRCEELKRATLLSNRAQTGCLRATSSKKVKTIFNCYFYIKFGIRAPGLRRTNREDGTGAGSSWHPGRRL